MNKRQLIPVIHHRDVITTLYNAEIAAKVGCEYVSLIQMEGRDNLLDEAFRAIRKDFPDLKAIINRLSLDPSVSYLVNRSLGANGTWADKCGVHGEFLSQESSAIATEIVLSPNHKFFGGVAFKYQEHEKYPELAAKTAYDLGFIPTTSGLQTGSAPDIDKIKCMANALPERILAVASGITPENVTDFAPYVNYYFVATGISRDFYHFDFDKVNKLQEIISNSE